MSWRDNIKMVSRKNRRYDITLGDYWWSPASMTWVDNEYGDKTLGIYRSVSDAFDAAKEIASPPHGYMEKSQMSDLVKFKVGDTGITRGGSTYRIIYVLNGSDWPVVAVIGSGAETVIQFSLDGKYPTNLPLSGYDLMPPTVTQYINLYWEYGSVNVISFLTEKDAKSHAAACPKVKWLKIALPIEIDGR